MGPHITLLIMSDRKINVRIDYNEFEIVKATNGHWCDVYRVMANGRRPHHTMMRVDNVQHALGMLICSTLTPLYNT